MLSIGRTIISMDLLERKFICDLEKCRGHCCYYGESGAPLTEEEGKILEDIYPAVSSYMRPEGKGAVDRQGTSLIDSDGDRVTPLVGKDECAYAIVEDGIYKCAIERAWSEKVITFRKPQSCHLFPVRVTRYREFDAVNYEELKICKPAAVRGEKEGVYAYQFLKDPLIRVFGRKWYDELTVAAEEIKKRAQK